MLPPAEAPGGPAVSFDGIVKRFAGPGGPIAALDGVGGAVLPGAVTGLVGPDGAGKTTLLRVVAGLLAPDAGTVSVLGRDPATDAPGARALLGYMPQRFGLYEDLTVAENLDLYADLRDLPPDSRRDRFAELMALSGLAPFTRRLAGALSGGMKQKLGLACTLLGSPRVLLLDEPSVGVDPVSRADLWSLVRRLAGDGMAVVWSTAYMDEAARCDRVILLGEGRVLGEGPPASFLDRVAGRCFRVPVAAAARRSAAARALAADGVIDAWVQGGGLRLVTAPGSPPPVASALGTAEGPRPVPPRFEDAYVALLHRTAAPAPADPPAPAADPAPAGGEAVIETRDLTRRFGAFTAVDGVSLRVAAGEIFGLLGPNGAGKSTTFKMLCGLLAPSGGMARVAGFDMMRARAPARGAIGYMAQAFAHPGHLTVRQNLAFNARAYGLGRRLAAARMAEAFQSFGLASYADTSAGSLPLGIQRRLSLACAILHRPRILFLDEPTSGVDPLMRREFWQRINAMAAAGVTVMVTSHFMEEAEYCDRLGVIYRGRLIALGPPDEVKRAHAGGGEDATLEDAFIGLIRAYDRDHAA